MNLGLSDKINVVDMQADAVAVPANDSAETGGIACEEYAATLLLISMGTADGVTLQLQGADTDIDADYEDLRDEDTGVYSRIKLTGDDDDKIVKVENIKPRNKFLRVRAFGDGTAGEVRQIVAVQSGGREWPDETDGLSRLKVISPIRESERLPVE